MLPQSKSLSPPWIGMAGRVLAFTFLLTLLSFAVALLVSIVGTIIYAQFQHVAPNLMYAYQRVAFPIALGVGTITLVVTLVVEIRDYRQRKVLAAIERSS